MFYAVHLTMISANLSAPHGKLRPGAIIDNAGDSYRSYHKTAIYHKSVVGSDYSGDTTKPWYGTTDVWSYQTRCGKGKTAGQ